MLRSRAALDQERREARPGAPDPSSAVHHDGSAADDAGLGRRDEHSQLVRRRCGEVRHREVESFEPFGLQRVRVEVVPRQGDHESNPLATELRGCPREVAAAPRPPHACQFSVQHPREVAQHDALSLRGCVALVLAERKVALIRPTSTSGGPRTRGTGLGNERQGCLG